MNMNNDSPITEISAAPNPSGATAKPSPKKVIVAVHGIGEHFRYETVQAVARQFCRNSEVPVPAALPLGRFYSGLYSKDGQVESNAGAVSAALVIHGFPGPDLSEELGFAEVYWASIPHAPDRDRFLLEESQKWATTVVERLRLHYETNSKELTAKDCERVALVLAEMIQAVDVMERVFFLAEKATKFRFDLKKVLVDHLGDVQMVTEFKQFREDILKIFNGVMEKIAANCPGAEIHIVAHSEGTVISFLGMLRALNNPSPPAWAKMVRGFMTIGSPIDKHLLLWPELWTELKPLASPPESAARVKWINYYDYGDPIGFELPRARKWLEHVRDGRTWSQYFDFAPDIGFGRYPFPGKAHSDYWNDDSVFKHFIKCVVLPEKQEAPAQSPAAAKPVGAAPGGSGANNLGDTEWCPGFKELRPRDRFDYRIGSYVVPYFGIAVLFFAAVYLVYKAVWAGLYPDVDEELWPTIFDVAGIASLLAGITVAVRIPHLTGEWLLRGLGLLLFLLSGVAYSKLVNQDTRIAIGKALLLPIQAIAGMEFAVTEPVTTMVALGFALLLVVIATLIGWRQPRSATKWLVVLISATVVGLASYLFVAFSKTNSSLWPFFLAAAAFLYLWWLGVLAFDLVFIWHRYIRYSVVVHRSENFTAKSVAAKQMGIEKDEPNKRTS
jgi:hypothetical protein